MYSEKNIQETLDKTANIFIVISEMSKHPMIKEYLVLCDKAKKMIDQATEMIINSDVNITQSTDGSIIAMQRKTAESLDTARLIENGLMEQILKTNPEAVEVHPARLRNTVYGSLSGYASKPSKTSGVVLLDDEYKAYREKMKMRDRAERYDE